MSGSRERPLWIEAIAAGALYAVLTVVMAWPLSRHPGSTVLPLGADTNLFLWTIGWDVHALVHQPLAIFDANIFFPLRHTLAYSENAIGSAILAAPVLAVSGNPVLALNAVLLAACVLCGVGAFVLARRLEIGPGGALLTGLIFAFSPPRFFRTGQLHLAAIHWLPFCLASLHQFLKTSRARDAWWTCVFLAAEILTSGHGTIFILFAASGLVLWHLAFAPDGAGLRSVERAAAPCLLTAVMAAAVFAPYRAVQLETGLERTLEDSDAFSPNAWAFVASPAHVDRALFGLAGANPMRRANAILFPGFIALTLGIVGGWYSLIASGAAHPPREDRVHGQAFVGRVRDAIGRRGPLLYYTALVVASLWLALGPAFGLYWVVHNWPGLSFIRVPSRFTLVTLLGLSVLAGAAFERLVPRRKPAAYRSWAALAAILVAVEAFAAPLAIVEAKTPLAPAADRWLATQPGPFVVAEFPFGDWTKPASWDYRQSEYMLHSTAHWQKTIHGYSGITPHLHAVLYREIANFPDTRSLDRLEGLGVTFVVVHTRRYRREDWPAVDAGLQRFPEDLTLAYEDDEARVYRVRLRRGP